MSLLLDAFKKSMLARSAKESASGTSREESGLGQISNAPPAEDQARSAGKNLFNAKSLTVSNPRLGGINRNLLFALCGTVLLLSIGGGFLWYLDATSSTPPLRVPATASSGPVSLVTPPITAAPNQNDVTVASASVTEETSAPVMVSPLAPVKAEQTKRVSGTTLPKHRTSQRLGNRIQIKPKPTGQTRSLIDEAYQSYRDGKFYTARQMYSEVLRKDARNIDAMLGLAAIDQRTGDDISASQYYLRVLTQDPRNAVANAGMSVINRDQGNESRLKNLLREQPDSAALNFALGNIFAAQSRWGEAQTVYFKAYTLDAKNPELAFNLAVSLDHLGQQKLAAQYYQRALQLDPTGEGVAYGFNHEQVAQRVQELTR